VPVNAENHRITELMRLAECLDLTAVPRVVCPRGPKPFDVPDRPYAVVHACPMFRYRRWTDEGWRQLVRALGQRGLAVVATGGPDPAEQAYLNDLFGPLTPPLVRLDARLEWPQLAALLQGAAVYVGPDTSMTHLAAASGCPTVGLYGPASPRRIGPWPVGGLAQPWEHAGTIQRRGNVWVVQQPLACLPCERVGCQNHVDSFSRCLDELPARTVLAAIDAALASQPGS
jgi:heptosyltransferase-3